MKLKNKKIKSSELKEKIAQYFEKSIESSGAFNSGDSRLKKAYIKNILENKIEKEIYQISKKNVKNLKRKKILDMGCGLGGFLAVCRNNKTQAVGMEIDPHAIEVAKLRTGSDENIVLGDCEKAPLSDNSFDLAVSITVIEHVKNPSKYLKEAHRILKKNGKLIIFAPNYLFPWEGHYKLFWLPYLFPYTKSLFKLYLKIKNRNPKFIDFINFKITPCYLRKNLKKAGFTKIRDLSLQRFRERMNKPKLITNSKPREIIKKIKKNKLFYQLLKISIPLLKILKIYHPLLLIAEK
jgi:ubiquinone/menaquinone biosynthesis C-methylase UbiE